MENQPLELSVSEFLGLTNQVLDGAFPSVVVEGEVASFKVNQGKFVFFDLKDSESSVGCFMMVFALRQPIEGGMRVRVVATPKLTKWGKFSLTVQTIQPVGEGELKKSMQLLQAKLEKESIFAAERKRPLPIMPKNVAVISSQDAAGYHDFIKIINDRWGGLAIELAHVQVQGITAPDQMIRALNHFNTQHKLPDVIVMVRGGGSADDLSAYNDELLVRAVAASRVPILSGIGHEVDTSLVDLAADVRAATPSNAAQLLVPDRREIAQRVRHYMMSMVTAMTNGIESCQQDVAAMLDASYQAILRRLDDSEQRLQHLYGVLRAVDPRRILQHGYSIIRGRVKVGEPITIERDNDIITAEVTNVKKR